MLSTYYNTVFFGKIYEFERKKTGMRYKLLRFYHVQPEDSFFSPGWISPSRMYVLNGYSVICCL